MAFGPGDDYSPEQLQRMQEESHAELTKENEQVTKFLMALCRELEKRKLDDVIEGVAGGKLQEWWFATPGKLAQLRKKAAKKLSPAERKALNI